MVARTLSQVVAQGEVVKSIPAEELCRRFRKLELFTDQRFAMLQEMLDTVASDSVHQREALWDEAAKMAGFDSVRDLQASGFSLKMEHGTYELVLVASKANG